MAQAGFTPIKLYYSTSVGVSPSGANLSYGELAINIADGKVFYKDSGNVVRTVADKNWSGTVTSVSVASANGFAGTVANSTTTPAITLSTSITGLLKGNGTAISAATSGTDYAPATSGTSILYGNGSGGFSNVTIGTGLSFSTGTLSSTTAGMVYPGTGIPNSTGSAWGTSYGTSGANSVVLRDANQNIAVNAVDETFLQQAATTPITLTASSARRYSITGSGGQTIQLPNATTLANGAVFQFDNNQSSGAITVNNNSATLVVSVPSGGYVIVVLLSNATAAGSWDRHDITPSNVSWSTNTFDYPGSITSATWNGTTVQVNRGGTGVATLSGIVKGNGTSAFSAAAAATDYVAPSAYASENGLTMATARLLGRTTASSGAAEEITVGSGLSLSGGSLTATGSGGTVTSVSFTGGIVSVATATTTPALTVAGTSGGIPYFNSASAWNSSAALALNAIVLGGGAGSAPATTTTGTGVVTAIGNAVNTTGGIVTQSGTLALNALLLGGGSGSAIASTTTGTGVVTALGVSTNNATGGLVTSDGTTTLTNKTLINYTETVYAVVDAAGVALSPTNGTIQTWTLGASRTPTAGTWAAGQSMTLMINDTVSTYTVTWTTIGVVWVGGSAPVLTPGGGFTIIELWKVGSTIYGALVGNVA